MKRILLPAILLLNFSFSFTQNLIENGDFETFKDSTIKSSQNINDLKGSWVGFQIGSSGSKLFYYCQDDTGCVNIGRGALMYSLDYYPEIIGDVPSVNGLFQTELTESLKKEKEYIIELYIRFTPHFKNNREVKYNSNKTIIPTTCFGVALSSDNLMNYSKRIERTGEIMLSSKYKYEEIFKPVYFFPSGKIVKDYRDWQRLSFIYKAKGGEKFLQFGSYDTKKFFFVVRIDDVSVKENIK